MKSAASLTFYFKSPDFDPRVWGGAFTHPSNKPLQLPLSLHLWLQGCALVQFPSPASRHFRWFSHPIAHSQESWSPRDQHHVPPSPPYHLAGCILLPPGGPGAAGWTPCQPGCPPWLLGSWHGGLRSGQSAPAPGNDPGSCSRRRRGWSPRRPRCWPSTKFWFSVPPPWEPRALGAHQGAAASRPPGAGARRGADVSGAVLQHHRAAPLPPAPVFAPRGPRGVGLGGIGGAAEPLLAARCRAAASSPLLSSSLLSSAGGSRSPALALRRPKRRAPVRSDVLRGISSTCTRWSRRAVAAPPRLARCSPTAGFRRDGWVSEPRALRGFLHQWPFSLCCPHRGPVSYPSNTAGSSWESTGPSLLLPMSAPL